MRPIFMPSLLNEPTGDPGLWVDISGENRAVLLDLGDLSAMSARKLLRVERVLVTHTHMDHFIGFDRLLRLCLGREKELVVTGPAGFLDRIQGKIDAYTWNLIESYPVVLRAEEIDGDTVRSTVWSGAGGMAPESRPQRKFEGILHAERLYTFHGAVLDHGVPVLAAALRETEHISVNKDRLLRAGLEPGPWLRDLKQAVRRCLPDDDEITATMTGGGEKTCTIADLSAELLLRSPGQRIAYVTDMHNTPGNVEKVLDLAKDADLLVCETAFLHEDRGLARERMHLTARDAGEIARAAGARRLAPFHLSPRYKGREDEIVREAADAFGGPVLTLTNTGASRTVPHGAVSRG